jgi:hypothetical protein
MPKKLYKVLITLPDLVAAHAEQEVTIESSNWVRAVKLACEEISNRPHVAGKHIKSAKIHFTIIDSGDITRLETKQPKEENAGSTQRYLFEL